MQKITPFLWFDGAAEEAAEFYVSLFPDSAIQSIARCGEGAPQPAGSVMTVAFQLSGQEFVALNGGPQFTFSPAISFVVNCRSQQEVDGLWEKLSAGGEEQPCGWLKDRFGVSWQIVPTVLGEMLSDPDTEKTRRVMAVMLGMKKIEIEPLRRAYDSEGP